MKRNLTTVLLAGLLIAYLAPPAAADVLPEFRDDFLEDHYQACTYQDRYYTLNGPEGYVSVYAAPDQALRESALLNGEEVWGAWAYTDGDGARWVGLAGEEDPAQWAFSLLGWVRETELAPHADSKTFAQQYGGTFTDLDGAFLDAFAQAETVAFWDYPHCGAEPLTWTGDEVRDWLGPEGDASRLVTACYVDAGGQTWGHVTYFYGRMDRWVCLSDPENITPDPDPTLLSLPELVPPAEELPAGAGGFSILAICLVAAVVIATAVLIPILCRRRKPKA